MKRLLGLTSLCALANFRIGAAYAATCGSQAGGALCEGNKECCSQYGYCGTTDDFCLTSKRCQSQCINDGPPPPPKGPDPPNIDVGSLFKPAEGTFANKGFVGYFTNWAQYRGLDPSTPGCQNKNLSFLPEHINPHLYTHLNYAFVFMAENYSIIPHEYDDEDLSLRFNRWVKKVNPKCTTAFAVGGWSMNDGPSKYTGGIDYSTFFSKMAAAESSRKTFIDSCISWARKYEFDGVDIDWEYPGMPDRGGGPADTENFTKLVREMRAAFRAEADSSGKKELLITVASAADPEKFALIQGKIVSEYIDWYNLMSYDFFGSWDSSVENHAPIRDTRKPGWSFTGAIDNYLKSGVPANKIYAGIPLYGRVWTLSDPSQVSPGAPGTIGVAGRCTAQEGYLAYFEIQEIRDVLKGQNMETTAVQFIAGNGYTMTWDNQWIGFDDEHSFTSKMEVINDRGLAGAMVWAVDQDTPKMDATKRLLDTFRACPRDGDWPTTALDTTAEIECPLGSIIETGIMTRTCKKDGTWDKANNSGCKGAMYQNSYAAEVCVR